MNCLKCGKELKQEASFCPSCGSPITSGTGFMIVTTPTLPGYKIKKIFGVVTGLTPRTRGVLGKFVASIQTMVGGEVTSFTQMSIEARNEAFYRLLQEAANKGANGIVGVKFDSSSGGTNQAMTEIVAYGTAVVLQQA